MSKAKRTREVEGKISRSSLNGVLGTTTPEFDVFRTPKIIGMVKSLSTHNTPIVQKTPLLVPGEFYKCNINVVVRLRGRSEEEIRKGSEVVITQFGGKLNQIRVDQKLKGRKEDQLFKFDSVFGSDTTQSQFFAHTVIPYVADLLNGINCTLFAYGQTGTGKTYTMGGDLQLVNGILSDGAGIVPRTLQEILYRMQLLGLESTLKLSMVEIYLEEANDLLAGPKDVPIKLVSDFSGKLKLQNLNEIEVKSLAQGLKLVRKGLGKRQTSPTLNNSKSSRSHCIVTLTLTTKSTTSQGFESTSSSKLCLVDLAGSENAKTSGSNNSQVREAGQINSSLLALSQCITTLAKNSTATLGNDKTFLPVRNSKLTRILEDSLTGSTKTCIIATVSPVLVNLEESVHTLNYAQRAMKVTTTLNLNKKISPTQEILNLKATVKSLEKKLEGICSQPGTDGNQAYHDAQVQVLRKREEELENLKKLNYAVVQDKDELAKQLVESDKLHCFFKTQSEQQALQIQQLHILLDQSNLRAQQLDKVQDEFQTFAEGYKKRDQAMEKRIVDKSEELNQLELDYQSQLKENQRLDSLVASFANQMQELVQSVKNKGPKFIAEQKGYFWHMNKENSEKQVMLDQAMNSLWNEILSMKTQLQKLLTENIVPELLDGEVSETFFTTVDHHLTEIKAQLECMSENSNKNFTQLTQQLNLAQADFTQSLNKVQTDFQGLLERNQRTFRESLANQRVLSERTLRRITRDGKQQQEMLTENAQQVTELVANFKSKQDPLIENVLLKVAQALAPLRKSTEDLQFEAHGLSVHFDSEKEALKKMNQKLVDKVELQRKALTELESNFVKTNKASIMMGRKVDRMDAGSREKVEAALSQWDPTFKRELNTQNSHLIKLANQIQQKVKTNKHLWQDIVQKQELLENDGKGLPKTCAKISEMFKESFISQEKDRRAKLDEGFQNVTKHHDKFLEEMDQLLEPGHLACAQVLEEKERIKKKAKLSHEERQYEEPQMNEYSDVDML